MLLSDRQGSRIFSPLAKCSSGRIDVLGRPMPSHGVVPQILQQIKHLFGHHAVEGNWWHLDFRHHFFVADRC